MRELFDKLLLEGEAGIERLVTERTQESVTLDFKEKVTASHGEVEKKDRQVFGKILSAFSNSTGGLVIYGVEAKPGDDKVDRARSLKPIANVERFEVDMRRASGELLQPRHEGVDVRSIPTALGDGSGYLLVRVDRSERRPHRSEAAGDEFYYKRGGDSSYKMQHFDVEDMFKRISSPGLIFTINRKGTYPSGTKSLLYITLQLTNASNITAKFPYLHVGALRNCSTNQLIKTKYEYELHKGRHMFSAPSDIVINPSVSSVPGYLVVQVGGDDNLDPKSVNDNEQISFKWQFGCENTIAKTGVFECRLGDLTGGDMLVSL